MDEREGFLRRIDPDWRPSRLDLWTAGGAKVALLKWPRVAIP